MNLFKKLTKLPPQGFWALLNNRNKKIYIVYSVDLLGSVAKAIRMMNRNEHPIEALNRHKNVLSLIILDDVVLDDRNARIQMNYWINKYKKRGYKLYNIIARTELRITYDVYEGKMAAILKNSRNEKQIVGLFDDLFGVATFIETFYVGDVIFPVYATNEATREYIKNQLHD
jgi:peroxiredoxin family protein